LDLKSKQIQEFKETEIGKIPVDWDVKKISEIDLSKNGVQTGPFGSLLHAHDYQENGIPLILVKHVKDGHILEKNLPLIGEKKYSELSKFVLKEDDIVFTRVGYVGNTAYVEEKHNGWLFSGQTLRIRIKNPQINNRFLSYFFQTENFKNIASSVVLGSTRDSINTQILKNIPIPIPSKKEQDKIVSIVFPLITKIQNLQNQNHALEQMAQSIFKSWFVDFGGVTEFEDSELGKIPKGWSVKQIKDFCKVRRGASPRPVGDPKYFGGDIPWIKIADVSKSPSPYLFSTKETVTEEGAKKSVHLPKNSLIISNSGTVGKPIFLTRDGCIHDGWLYFENLIEISQEFLYFHILTLTTHLNLIGDGTVQKNLNTTMVGEIKFVCPEKKYLDSFLKISQIFLKTIKENQIKINTLISIRDALLPKLMSGEIRV
jgi:type I restriction enzyme S subunit